MSITALHIPHGRSSLAKVTVNERNATSYYPYVHGGPVEGARVRLDDLEAVLYVNSRYMELGENLTNERATMLLKMAGVGMAGGSVRGDALLVRGSGGGGYERSLPPNFLSIFLGA